MFRSVRWYTRELERRERAWAAERAELIATICHLSGKPLPKTADPTLEPDDDETLHDFVDPAQLP